MLENYLLFYLNWTIKSKESILFGLMKLIESPFYTLPRNGFLPFILIHFNNSMAPVCQVYPNYSENSFFVDGSVTIWPYIRHNPKRVKW